VEGGPVVFGQRFCFGLTRAVRVVLSVRAVWLFEVREQPLEGLYPGSGVCPDDNISDGPDNPAVRLQLRQQGGRLRLHVRGRAPHLGDDAAIGGHLRARAHRLEIQAR